MSIKKFGIYLAYPPTVDLCAQGLGKHLTEFLKGAQTKEDVRFVIVCPSWTRLTLEKLFQAADISISSVNILSPPRMPLLLRLYNAYSAYKLKTRDKKFFLRLQNIGRRIKGVFSKIENHFEKKLVSIRNVGLMVVFLIVYTPFLLLKIIFQMLKNIAQQILFIGRSAIARKIKSWILHQSIFLSEIKNNTLLHHLYQLMEESEVMLMKHIIEENNDVVAWYTPTAFWPHFNNIEAPRLMCVPDMVVVDFPIDFSLFVGEYLEDSFQKLQKAIEGGKFFVTYSSEIKWQTLVARYNISPESVFVIPHGVNRLDNFINVSGTPDDVAATDTLCRNLFRKALDKTINNHYASIYGSEDIRFIFYASQFRPSKNIISLLRAYEYLLKKRHIGCKLILTGDPNILPEIWRFIVEHNLENDVLCLYGLSNQELAACYRLADLAVNPSLSEGGCPFTFTEALSVGTPVVMARIPVTEEIITDAELQEKMFFDPYDWKDMAEHIEWGLTNAKELFEIQKPFYDRLALRTWGTVVDEYIAVLEHIAK